MFHFLQAVILGIVEGITEFLPISSTGHMVLVADVLHITETDFVKSFEVIIQLGAILAVLLLYWKKLLLNGKIFLRVSAAFIPTAILGLLLYSRIKHYLLGNASVVLWSLLIGGIVMIAFERMRGTRQATTTSLENITYKQAMIIGVFQSIAFIPGVSRSAATIVGGLSLGIARDTIVEFSFLLAIPTMVAATGLDIIKSSHSFASGEVRLLVVGLIAAFVAALVSIKFLLRYLKNHTLVPFGVYRIIIALFGMFLLV